MLVKEETKNDRKSGVKTSVGVANKLLNKNTEKGGAKVSAGVTQKVTSAKSQQTAPKAQPKIDTSELEKALSEGLSSFLNNTKKDTNDLPFAPAVPQAVTQRNYELSKTDAGQKVLENDYYKQRQKIAETSAKQAERFAKATEKVGTDIANIPFQFFDALKAYDNELGARQAQVIDYAQEYGYSNPFGYKNGEYQKLTEEDRQKNADLLSTYYREKFDPLDENNISYKLDQRSEQLTQEIYEGATDAEKAVLQVYESTLNFGAHYLMGMLTGGSTTLATMAFQSGVDKTYENLKEGYDIETAIGNGVLSGIVTAMTEKLPLDNFNKIVTSKVGQFSLAAIASQAASEGIEEGVEYTVNHFLDKLTLGKQEEYSFGELFENVMLGMAGGAVLGGIADIVPMVNSRKSVNALKADISTLEQFKAQNDLAFEDIQAIDNAINMGNIAISNYYQKSVVGDAIQFESDKVTPQNARQIQENFYRFLQPQVDAEAKANIESQNAAIDIANRAQDILSAKGIKMDALQYSNLSPETRSQVDKVQSYANDLGVNLGFDTTIDAHGMYDPNNQSIVINPNSELGPLTVFAHELTHNTEMGNTYASLSKLITDQVKPEVLQRRLNDIKSAYQAENINLNDNQALQEYVAIETQNQLGNDKFIKRLVKYNNSLAYRLYEGVKEMVSKNSNNTLEKIEYNFLKAFRDAGTSLNELSSQYAIGKTNDGIDVALADNAISRSEATDLKRVKKYLNDNIGKQFTINDDGSVIDYTKYDRNEYLYSKYSRRIGKINFNKLSAKNRIVTNFGDVVSVARNPSYQENYNGKVHQGDPDIGQKGFTHYDVTFGIPVKDNKGNITDYKLYDGELVVEHNANGSSTLYDIINIKNSHRELGDLTPMGGAIENESTHRSDYSSENNISNSQEYVNNGRQNNEKSDSMSFRQLQSTESANGTTTFNDNISDNGNIVNDSDYDATQIKRSNRTPALPGSVAPSDNNVSNNGDVVNGGKQYSIGLDSNNIDENFKSLAEEYNLNVNDQELNSLYAEFVKEIKEDGIAYNGTYEKLADYINKHATIHIPNELKQKAIESFKNKTFYLPSRNAGDLGSENMFKVNQTLPYGIKITKKYNAQLNNSLDSALHEFMQDNNITDWGDNTVDQFNNLLKLLNASEDVPINEAYPFDSMDEIRTDLDGIWDNIQKDTDLGKFNESLETYGAIKPGEAPRQDVEVPKQTAPDNKVSMATRTIAESEVFKGEALDDLKAEIGKGTFSYKPVSNESLVERANSRLNNVDNDTAVNQYLSLEKANSSSIAQGEVLLRKLGEAGDTKNAIKVAAKLTEQMSEAGRQLQAMRILKRLSPEGRLVSVQQEVSKIQNSLDIRHGNKAPDLTIPEELQDKLLKAQSQQEVEDALNEISKNIARQIPSTTMDKLNAWRYLSMLGNPRTHIRNIVGNLVFKPVVDIKNYVGAGIEKIAQKTGKLNERTKTVLTSKDKHLVEFAKKDYDNNASSVMKENGKYDITDLIRQNRDVFSNNNPFSRTLNYLVKKNSELLDMEDVFFSKNRYASSLAQFMKANNLTENDVDSELFKKGQEYAMSEALKATYRDDSKIAEALTKIANVNRGTRWLFDAVLPFKRTPINIVKRGVEYSPANFLYTLGKRSFDLKSGRITANEFIDNLSKGLTGSGIALIGYLLASKGILRITDDDKDRKQRYDEELGEQDYALVFPFGSYTIDWASPSIMPMAIGAEVFRQLTSENEGNIVDNAVELLTSVAEPIFETSMLSGLMNTINSFEQGSAASAFDMLSNATSSYILQYVPTFAGQVARIIDGTQRTTYPNTGIFEKTVRQVLNKIPGLSYLNQPSINKQGEEIQREDLGMGAFGRSLLELFSPGYYKSNKTDKTSDELNRLYEATGDIEAIPSNTSNSVTYDGETYKLYGEDYTNLQKDRYSMEDEYVKEFLNSEVYGGIDDSQRVGIIADIRDYAQKQAKNNFLKTQGVEYEDSSLDKANDALDAGMDLFEYYMTKEFKSNLSGDNQKEEYVSYLANSDFSDEAKEIMYSQYYKGSYVDYVKKNPVVLSDDYIGEYERVMSESSKSSKKSSGSKRSSGSSTSGSSIVRGLTKTQTRNLLKSIANNQESIYKKIDDILDRYVYDKSNVDSNAVKVAFQKEGLSDLIDKYLEDHPYVDKSVFGL